MTNRSRKEYAYTILDVVSDLPADCIQKINAIDGVIPGAQNLRIHGRRPSPDGLRPERLFFFETAGAPCRGNGGYGWKATSRSEK